MSGITVLVLMLTMTIATSCKERKGSGSHIESRYDAKFLQTSVESLRTFIRSSELIVSSQEQNGFVSPAEFIDLIPLNPIDHASVVRAFPSDFEVKCDSNICEITAVGRQVDVTLQAVVKISPLIAADRPVMRLESNLKAKFVIENSPEGVRFCNIKGMFVSKYLSTEKIIGLVMRVQGDGLAVTVGTAERDILCAQESPLVNHSISN